jgi:hypothetical protein
MARTPMPDLQPPREPDGLTTWQVVLTLADAEGRAISTRIPSEDHPRLRPEDDVFEFRVEGEIMGLVPRGVVAYIKRVTVTP